MKGNRKLGRKAYIALKFLTILACVILLGRFVCTPEITKPQIGQTRTVDSKSYMPGRIRDSKGNIILKGVSKGVTEYNVGYQDIYEECIGAFFLDSTKLYPKDNEYQYTLVPYLKDVFPYYENNMFSLNPFRERKGGEIQLTLDSELMKSLKHIKDNYKDSENLEAIITNYKTGEIIALTSPKVFSRIMHPGSVAKITDLICASEILGDEEIKNITFECNLEAHRYKINNEDIIVHCYAGTNHGYLNHESAFAYSCNAYFQHLIMSLDPEDLSDQLENLGYGVQIDNGTFCYADSSYLSKRKDIDIKKEMLYGAIGQGDNFTSVYHQNMITAAVLNDGISVEPHTISKEDDEPIKLSNTKKICSKETARLVKDDMKAVVEYGTASRRFGNYNSNLIAKTGTAENLPIDASKYITSWITMGVEDENNPYAITVCIDNQGSDNTDTQIIMQQICEILNIN